MPGITARTVMAALDLPPPPGTPEREGISPFVVIAIVVVVLGGTVLIARLLMPLAARRLIEAEAIEAVPETVPPNETEVPTRAEAGDVSTASEAERAREPAPVAIVPQETEGGAAAVDVVVVPPVSPVSEAPGGEVEAEEIAGITLTVRKLLDYANAGQVLRGFALYSESFLRRFRAETGLSTEEFNAVHGAIPAPPPEARAELAAVTDVERLPDGRVSALVSYRNGGTLPRPERFVFVRVTGNGWLIDDIIMF